jgi:hypothetical protein
MPSQEAPTGRTFLQEGWFIFFGDMDAPTEHPTNNQCGTWLKFFGIASNDDLPSGGFPKHFLHGRCTFLDTTTRREKRQYF